MFDALLKSKFYTKCKSGIKLTKTRIQMIKRKRNAMLKYLKNDVSDLLKNGLDPNAYGRVEGLWNEMNLSSCYDFVEKFCVDISSHLANMDKQRECPEECREAVSSLMFAAARFADLPELRELRAIFTERYGNSIECYANKEFVHKLKATPPTNDVKLQLMKDIASECGIEWNSKALEQELYSLSAPARYREKNDENEESFDKGAGYKHEHQKGLTSLEKESNSPKKKEKVVVEGKHLNYQSYEEEKDSNYIKDARVDRINRKQQKKHYNPKGFTPSARVVEEVSSHRIKELTGGESNLPMRTENVVPEEKHQNFPSYGGAEDYNDSKHVGVDRSNRKEQQNGPQILGGTSRGDAHDKPFYYKPFRPPYTKPRTSNAASSLTVPPTGTENEVPEHTKGPGHIDRRNHPHQEDQNDRVKPVPKSVRSRYPKPQLAQDQEDEKQHTQLRKASDDDPRDEEERKLDWLLARYSKKKSPSDEGKLEPVNKLSTQQAVADNSTGRQTADKGKDGPPTRIASLPNEPSLAEIPRNVHTRAASFQAENHHVHPKPPEYEDFVARLAAFRSKLE